jgi:tetratricopeptide (TPR) repeat protein
LPEAKRQEVTRLIKRGLNSYGLGDVQAAIQCWESALALDPENGAARDYLETAYEEVRDGAAKTAPPHAEAAPARAARAPDDDSTPRTAPTRPRAEPAPPGKDAGDALIESALAHYRAGDLDSAWRELAEALRRAPARLDLQGYVTMVRNDRAQRFAREIGDQGRTLRRKLTMHELMKHNLAPDEGFLLSQIDGTLSIDQLLSMASTDRVRALEVIARFLREGLVE